MLRALYPSLVLLLSMGFAALMVGPMTSGTHEDWWSLGGAGTSEFISMGKLLLCFLLFTALMGWLSKTPRPYEFFANGVITLFSLLLLSMVRESHHADDNMALIRVVYGIIVVALMSSWYFHRTPKKRKEEAIAPSNE